MPNISLAAQRVLSPVEFTHPGDIDVVPAQPGIYGWWIRSGSLEIPVANYQQQDGFELIYVGISPRKPSAAGRLSKGNIRRRLNQHVNGNASQSTLRRSLGVLLMEALDMTLILRKGRYLWDKEAHLTDWMHDNARIGYVVDDAPWLVEDELLAQAVLALNIQGRGNDPFAKTLAARRRAARAVARLN